MTELGKGMVWSIVARIDGDGGGLREVKEIELDTCINVEFCWKNGTLKELEPSPTVELELERRREVEACNHDSYEYRKKRKMKEK